jgi:hypothetical protein
MRFEVLTAVKMYLLGELTADILLVKMEAVCSSEI